MTVLLALGLAQAVLFGAFMFCVGVIHGLREAKRIYNATPEEIAKWSKS